ncbi:hypothetical protein DWW95_09080 [Ruminococcus sp. AF17-6LB]|uniref:fibronectin type III domain-containing protein n=1 Tax=unclassified Ruminococcus TaxID=2608920 RepID=UPI000E4DE2C3|nr:MULTISPECIES: fibronectin type III domain-containing protein [unclassified Ruminococcus]RGG69620.1 hypothetical protein DWW95_09080 [Ruminococcus sp. AF17-6LB]RGG71276.1 hypothetical protein DWW87_09390 [Ruminococcus sp. AF17-24]RGG78449.1 hypothetical protein DWW81_09810 [Ruminococcus sp. AF17-1AC]
MNMKKRMLSIVLSGAMAVSTAVSAGSFSAFAAAQCVAYSGSNVNAQDYVQWSDTVKSYLTVCDNGNYMRVQSGAIEGKLLVEYYSSDFEPLSTKLIDNELPIFGAFYDSGNNYYVLSGQENPKQNDSLEVFRITKYDKNWNKIKSCGLYGANTTVPFDAGSARMTHSGDHLLVRTCHEMYKSSDGNNHQANVTIEVDMPSMTITDSYTGIMNVDYGYVSHSFNQFIKTDGNHIVALDHGDAHPRSAVLVKYNSDFTTGKFFPSYFEQVSNIDVVTYPEYTAGHYNYTGAAIGGFDVSSSSYIVAQSTVDLDYINTSKTRNVYVSAVSKDLSINKLNKITSYAEGTDSASAPQLVKINDNSFLLLWARDTKVSCVKLNADGTVNGSIHTFEGSLSDCQPVIKNGRAVWYVYDKNNVTFNSLNLSNLDDIKTVDVKTGHDYETKYASKTDGTVTQTCKSCGYVNKFTVPTSTTVYWRTDLSNTTFSSVLSKTQFSVGDSIDFWLYDDTDYTVEFSDRSMVSVNKLENYANDIRRITFKNGGSLTVKIYPTYNPSVAKTYKFTCGCTSHTYGSAVVTKQPTCTSEGTKTKTCTQCGATVTETIAKLSHSYTTTVVAPTCTTDGYTLHKCSVCGTSYKDNTTKATGHSFGNSVVTKQPTCTSEGAAIKTCTKCNATVTEKLPAKGHTAVTDKGYPATCTTAGKTDGSHCSVCNTVIKVQTVINATGHKSSGWIVDKAASIGVKGSKHRECTICKKVLETAEIPALSRISISKASVTLSTSTYAYDGKAKKPGVTVKLNGKTLKNGTDYTVSYSNNIKVGTAKVTITGKGNYTGSVSKTYSIKNNFKKATVSGISTKAFTGKNITQSITVKYNGKTLKKGTDYTVSYSSSKKIGTATVKIAGKGSYTGTITKTFKINPAKQEIQKLTAKSKAFFVDWAQKGSATGYEIQYATNSKFTSAKKVTITNNKTDKTTVSKLSGKKKYYVRVRSYTTVKGTKYYGAWSASKSVTTKK